jgi:cytochrome c
MIRKCNLEVVLAAVAALGLHAPAHAQDAAAGKQVFVQCAACHMIDGSNMVGPSLQGIVGRTSGTAPGFRYSRALKTAAKTWDDASLDAYIADPQKFIPGNLMPYSGISDARQRADLIAYLKTLK